jgi:hypothetical protein
MRNLIAGALGVWLGASACAHSPPEAPPKPAGPAAASDEVQFTIITPKGSVTFATGGEWTVGPVQTKLPVAVMAFQIQDPADEGTPDSTNVIISLYDPATPEGRHALETMGKSYGPVAPTASRVGEWQVFDQRAAKTGTEYTILDARRDVADVTVGVRLAWPHLPAHAKGHEAAMRRLFSRLLTSVHGELGEYKPRPGENVLRPTGEH